jgi:hypothetical protein
MWIRLAFCATENDSKARNTVIVFERLLTSWLFWLAMLVIGLTIGINEAFFPRHVPEAKPERPVISGAPDSSK